MDSDGTRQRQRYEIDLVALSYRNAETAQGVHAFLSEKIEDPRFNLNRACRKCLLWDHGRRTYLGEKPGAKAELPGATDATAGCSGCAFSYLEPSRDEAGRISDRPTIESKMRATARAIRRLSGETPENPVMLERWQARLQALGDEWDAANESRGGDEPWPDLGE